MRLLLPVTLPPISPPLATVGHDGVVQRRRAVVLQPPPLLAELPLTVQLVSVAVPSCRQPPPSLAELPLMVQLDSVSRAAVFSTPPPS